MATQDHVYVVEQRSEFCFAVLMPNSDWNKPNVSYSGRWLTMCTTDGREEAQKIARALTAYDAPKAVADAPATRAA